MYRMSHYVPDNVLLNVYYTLVYPYLTYCNVVCGGSATVHLNKLLIMQKKEGSTNIISHSEFLANTDPLIR